MKGFKKQKNDSSVNIHWGIFGCIYLGGSFASAKDYAKTSPATLAYAPSSTDAWKKWKVAAWYVRSWQNIRGDCEQAIDNNGVLVACSIVESYQYAVIVNAAVPYLHSVFIAHWDIKPLPPASLPFVGNKAHWLWCSGGTQGVFLAEFVQPEFWDWFNFLNMKNIQKGYERIQKAKKRLKCEHSLRYFWMYLSWWFFCICKGLCKDKSCNSGLCSEFHGCMEEVEGGRPWYVRSWQNIRGDCVKGWALTNPFKEDILSIMYINGILYRI